MILYITHKPRGTSQYTSMSLQDTYSIHVRYFFHHSHNSFHTVRGYVDDMWKITRSYASDIPQIHWDTLGHPWDVPEIHGTSLGYTWTYTEHPQDVPEMSPGHTRNIPEMSTRCPRDVHEMSLGYSRGCPRDVHRIFPGMSTRCP